MDLLLPLGRWVYVGESWHGMGDFLTVWTRRDILISTNTEVARWIIRSDSV